MKTLFKTITVLAGLFLLISCSSNKESASAQSKSEKSQSVQVKADVTEMHTDVDQPAPDFTLTDANGNKHSLSDYKGKYVVLEWINFGCPFVKAQYASGNMQSLQKKYTDEGVVWLTICSSAKGKQGYFTGEELRDQIKEHHSNATAYLIDADGSVGRTYEAKATPNMYVINPQGTLIYAGAIDDTPTTDASAVPKSTNYVSLALNASMKGDPVPVKTSQPYGCSVKY
ncbi:MAG TPA: thioredoxin family protein [candidate division Zixibacteria bacterium]|nr:thioredoxin family protein [candidate division Zixibacteria bacterium]